ncbi:MAG: NADH-quinone oxidoreductase subunit J [Chlamydiae bacterium]|nr:NADH-quinone oxidoreductase subunit J [Chlamydiota bacterium]MBI3277764.1 NADH-quinone oxidoreductase subunit J [Chlamydiota bacterium]
MLESILFYCFATLAVITALLVIFTRHPVYSVLYLVLTMFALAALYLMLHAYFVAAIQLIVYAGAILVLFLFVVMLLNLDQEGEESFRSGPARWFAVPIALSFVTELYFVLAPFLQNPSKMIPSSEGTIEAVGHLLFTKHLLPFEIISFVLLTAILGVTVLSKKGWK